MELPSRLGTSVRSAHCTADRSAKVTRRAEGCAWYCFRCNESGWIPDVLPLAKRLEAEPDAGGVSALREPADRVIPDAYRAWLAQFGVSARHYGLLELGWLPRAQRLLWPVRCLNGGRLLTARSNTAQPKWLTDWRDVQPGDVPIYGPDSHGLLMLTEDAISAWKFSQAGFTAVPLIGTRITSAVLAHALDRRAVAVALDPDYYGQVATTTILARLCALGVPAKRLVLARDPKYHTTQELIHAVRALYPDISG